MTNHSGSTGNFDNGDISGRERPDDTSLPSYDGHLDVPLDGGRSVAPTHDGHSAAPLHDEHAAPPLQGGSAGPPPHDEHAAPPSQDGHGDDPPITLRTPAELADALPYLLGYRPEDSIVLVALYERDGRGRFGGRARLGIPPEQDDWHAAARQLVHGLVTGSERRSGRPERMVVYLCQEPGKDESGRQVMHRLRALAQRLRIECGVLDVPVVEALCLSDGRFWSYCCDQPCCPAEGTPMGLPGTSVLAAAATYAGLQVRGTLRELHVRLRPLEGSAAREQEVALDAVSMSLVSRILHEGSRAEVAEATLELAERVMGRLAGAPPVAGAARADLRDDGLLAHDEAARLILGLQDRTTRDRAAEWMEGDEAPRALRLWRALARRCTGSYGEYAAAPLTLAGWVAWSSGDELEAREALAMALAADPDYLFARLLHQACNEGLDPESVRTCLRGERTSRRPSPPAAPLGQDAGEREDRASARAKDGGSAKHEAAGEAKAEGAGDRTPVLPQDEPPPATGTTTGPTRTCAVDAVSGTRRRRGTRTRKTGTGHTRPRTPTGGTCPTPVSPGHARRSRGPGRGTVARPDVCTDERDTGGTRSEE